MSKRFLASLLIFIFVIMALIIPVTAASAPVQGDPAWDPAYSTNNNIPQLTPEKSSKDNASGDDKITSNAHSAD